MLIDVVYFFTFPTDFELKLIQEIIDFSWFNVIFSLSIHLMFCLHWCVPITNLGIYCNKILKL